MVFFVHSEEALQDSIRKWTRGRLHPHRRMDDADIGQRQSVQSLPSDGPSPPTAMLSAILPAPPHLYATARRLAQPLLPSFLPHLPWTICTSVTFFCETGTWARFSVFWGAHFSLWCGSVQWKNEDDLRDPLLCEIANWACSPGLQSCSSVMVWLSWE